MTKKFRKIHEFVALCSRGGRSNVLKMLVWIGKLEFVAIIGTVRSRRRRPDIRHLTTRIKMLNRPQPTQLLLPRVYNIAKSLIKIRKK